MDGGKFARPLDVCNQHHGWNETPVYPRSLAVAALVN